MPGGRPARGDLAQAIVDQVLERGRLLGLEGPSIRIKHLGLDAPASVEAGSAPPSRISGIDLPEFPEPTRATVQALANMRIAMSYAVKAILISYVVDLIVGGLIVVSGYGATLWSALTPFIACLTGILLARRSERAAAV